LNLIQQQNVIFRNNNFLFLAKMGFYKPKLTTFGLSSSASNAENKLPLCAFFKVIGIYNQVAATLQIQYQSKGVRDITEKHTHTLFAKPSGAH